MNFTNWVYLLLFCCLIYFSFLNWPCFEKNQQLINNLKFTWKQNFWLCQCHTPLLILEQWPQQNENKLQNRHMSALSCYAWEDFLFSDLTNDIICQLFFFLKSEKYKHFERWIKSRGWLNLTSDWFFHCITSTIASHKLLGPTSSDS